jgi:hypothetical protein
MKYTDFHLCVHFIHGADYINLLDASSVHLQIIMPYMMLITSVVMAQNKSSSNVALASWIHSLL